MLSALETELERACKLLESATPEAMDASAAALEGVVLKLTERRNSVSREEAIRLRTVLRRVRSLLELAARFHARWHDILAGMSGGYTSKGSPAAFHTRARVSVSG